MLNRGDIEEAARREGFHAIGITTAEPFLESRSALQDGYGKGLLGGLRYSADSIVRKTQPGEILPSARSVVSVALSYLTDDMPETPACGLEGTVARFACGLDYHPALRTRLERLAERLRRLAGGGSFRMRADNADFVDRPAAIRSGLGSRGLNACVYAGSYGSWVVLGELVTDLELPPDGPAAGGQCGDCRLCMEACPTGAIRAPHIVEVGRCLSFVTQASGEIPEEMRDKFGTRIYGCDTCQSVCPRNRCALPGNLGHFRPSSGIGCRPELLPLLSISPEEFRAVVGPTTAGWIGRSRFRRNVAVALGNLGDSAAVPALREALRDEDAMIRSHAAWSLDRIRRGITSCR